MAVGADIIVDLSDNDDDDCVLEAIIYNSKSKKQKVSVNCDHIFKENPLLAEVIEKCLNLENTEGMQNVLYKTLLDIYKRANPEFKLSSDFQTILKRTLINLDKDPGHKYSHIQELCNALRGRRSKLIRMKRAQLIKLDREEPKQPVHQASSELKRTNLYDKRCKRHKPDIIDLDNYEEIPTINLDQNDTDNDSPIIIDDEKENQRSEIINNCSTETIIDVSKYEDLNGNHTNKENVEKTNDILTLMNNIVQTGNTQENQVTAIENRSCISNENAEERLVNTIDEDNNIPESPEKLLLPRTVSTIDLVEEEPTSMSNAEKIKHIELEIAEYKQLIAILDEEEVTDDSTHSPYIRSEKLKEKIVLLYKELCAITGAEVTKRREVTLTVIEGHPPGPVKRLQRLLNSNIGSDGNPPFPDFSDVVTCVTKANISDNLGWNKLQVMREASALFTHCGRALQKRRQQREWNDLLSRVKAERSNDDPADRDPELLARLQANRRVAVKREADLLERYSMMQDLPPDCVNTTSDNEADKVGSVDCGTNCDRDEGLDQNDSLQINMQKNKTVAPTKEINTLDSNKLVNINSNGNLIQATNNAFVPNSCLIQNPTLVMPTIIAESITNKCFTDEFGFKIFNPPPIPHVVVPVPTISFIVSNFGLNVTNELSSEKVNYDLQAKLSVESTVGHNIFQSNAANVKSHVEILSIEPNVDKLNTEAVNYDLQCNVAKNSVESTVGDNIFQSDAANVKSHVEILSIEPNVDKLNAEPVNYDLQCNIANLNAKSAVQDFQSNAANCITHVEKVKLETNIESAVEDDNFQSNTKSIHERLQFEPNADCNLNDGEVKLETTEETSSFPKVKLENNDIDIKPDPTENVTKLLNDFCDNYTVTVFDIEDPFLVVEISDSSDDDESYL
ncbi:uncharacterized protein LOC112044598 [Bicyclus anynana]|uniref:Uncharacterized protein LOC112044598 n=1 Tax=Bicyclus anynana TaxID=110368 RepID=A0A6J1MTL7_BICAN|nr:uncharacterized protein LOC112044598 [Bicyclus anynana]